MHPQLTSIELHQIDTEQAQTNTAGNATYRAVVGSFSIGINDRRVRHNIRVYIWPWRGFDPLQYFSRVCRQWSLIHTSRLVRRRTASQKEIYFQADPSGSCQIKTTARVYRASIRISMDEPVVASCVERRQQHIPLRLGGICCSLRGAQNPINLRYTEPQGVRFRGNQQHTYRSPHRSVAV